MRRGWSFAAAIVLLLFVYNVVGRSGPSRSDTVRGSTSKDAKESRAIGSQGGVLSALQKSGAVVTGSGIRVRGHVLERVVERATEVEAPLPVVFVPPEGNVLREGSEIEAPPLSRVDPFSAIGVLLKETSQPEWLRVMGVHGSKPLERAISEGGARLRRLQPELVGDDEVEVWCGGRRILIAPVEGPDGLTIEANLSAPLGGDSQLITSVTIWTGQTIVLETGSRGSDDLQVVTLKLELLDPADETVISIADPFAANP